MAKIILLNSRVYANSADLSGVTNKASISGEREEKETTTFGSAGYKELIAGLGSSKFSLEGFWEAGDASKVDDEKWAALGGAGPWTVCPVAGAVSDVAYFSKVLTAKYGQGGAVGDVAPYKAEGSGTWPLVRGLVANPPGTARTTTGTGTAIQLGAVASGKQLYAAVHVLSVSGTGTPTVTFRIESDDNAGFSSATTRATFTAATAVSGEIIRAAGPFTDDYWRAAWTISGSSPSFLAAVVFGIA